MELGKGNPRVLSLSPCGKQRMPRVPPVHLREGPESVTEFRRSSSQNRPSLCRNIRLIAMFSVWVVPSRPRSMALLPREKKHALPWDKDINSPWLMGIPVAKYQKKRWNLGKELELKSRERKHSIIGYGSRAQNAGLLGQGIHLSLLIPLPGPSSTHVCDVLPCRRTGQLQSQGNRQKTKSHLQANCK